MGKDLEGGRGSRVSKWQPSFFNANVSGCRPPIVYYCLSKNERAAGSGWVLKLFTVLKTKPIAKSKACHNKFH